MMSTTEGELDIDISHEREDGELEDSDVEEGAYIPLTRPEGFHPPSLVHMQIQDDQSDEASEQESSCSDSDEEFRSRAKKTKLRLRRPPPPQKPDKKEKYNVWCKALQEDLLTEDMTSCDVSKKSRVGIEAYDYTIKYRLDDNYISKKVFSSSNDIDRTSNKRRHQDRSNIQLRLGKRVNSHHFPQERQLPKYLEDLKTNPEDAAEILAAEMADKLNEVKKDLIERIVKVLGASKAIELYKETQRIEADGGMLIMNGTRRRTPGGVYIFLLKGDESVPKEMISQIFVEDRKQQQRKIKQIRLNRQRDVERLKQSLTDSEIPSLSRCESTVQSEHGSNPPPSPVTDARDCSSDTDNHSHTETDRPPSPSPDSPHPRDPRALQDYDDGDFLEVMCNDDMDMF